MASSCAHGAAGGHTVCARAGAQCKQPQYTAPTVAASARTNGVVPAAAAAAHVASTSIINGAATATLHASKDTAGGLPGHAAACGIGRRAHDVTNGSDASRFTRR